MFAIPGRPPAITATSRLRGRAIGVWASGTHARHARGPGPGKVFPDLRLPEHTGDELSVSEIAQRRPLILCFARGWRCPKEQVRLPMLVTMQEELQGETARIAVVTVDGPYVNGAFRAGLGASFPFLSDERREVAEELDLLELTDQKHLPYLPTTFVLEPRRRIERVL